MISFMALDANGELVNSKMKPFTYPAGEVSIKFEDSRGFEKTELAIIQPEFGSIHNDLVSALMWNNVLNNNTYAPAHRQHLIIPYMPGAREDRGRVFGLEKYTEMVLTMLGNHSVVVFDPHSKVLEELFDGYGYDIELKTLSSADLVRQRPWAFKGYDYVIAPDEGATERAQSVADVLGVPVVQVKKSRDFDTGKILGFEVPEVDEAKKYLIVDDIVDKGGTFLGISEKIGLPKEQLHLYVSHGIFSGGTELLLEKFGKIITTNSYLGDHTGVEVLDVIRPMVALLK